MKIAGLQRLAPPSHCETSHRANERHSSFYVLVDVTFQRQKLGMKGRPASRCWLSAAALHDESLSAITVTSVTKSQDTVTDGATAETPSGNTSIIQVVKWSDFHC